MIKGNDDGEQGVKRQCNGTQGLRHTREKIECVTVISKSHGVKLQDIAASGANELKRRDEERGIGASDDRKTSGGRRKRPTEAVGARAR